MTERTIPTTTTRHVHEHDRGLSHDLPALLSRRRLLGVFGGAGALALAGCGVASSASPAEFGRLAVHVGALIPAPPARTRSRRRPRARTPVMGPTGSTC